MINPWSPKSFEVSQMFIRYDFDWVNGERGNHPLDHICLIVGLKGEYVWYVSITASAAIDYFEKGVAPLMRSHCVTHYTLRRKQLRPLGFSEAYTRRMRDLLTRGAHGISNPLIQKVLPNTVEKSLASSASRVPFQLRPASKVPFEQLGSATGPAETKGTDEVSEALDPYNGHTSVPFLFTEKR